MGPLTTAMKNGGRAESLVGGRPRYLRLSRYAVGVLALTVAGIALRVPGIGTRSFWFDEAFSWRIATFPLDEGVARIAQDNHPPLYFLLLKLWAAAVGPSESALRALSVLLGGATVAVGALTAREVVRTRDPRADGRAAGLIAAALIAVSVVQIRWSWEVRMYTLGTTLAVLTSWAMLRAVRLGTTVAWAGYGFLALAFAYTHYYALFSLAAQAVYVMAAVLRGAGWNPIRAVHHSGFWHALLVVGIVTLGWLPWVPAFLAQRQQVRNDYWSTPVQSKDVANGLYRMFVTPENGPIDPTAAWGLTAAALGVVVLLVCRRGAGDRYLALAACLPLLIPVALSKFGTDVFHPRYLLFGHVHLLVGLGVLVGGLRDALLRNALAVVLVGNSLVVCSDFWQHLRIPDRPGMRAAIAKVNAERRPGDWVVVGSPLLHTAAVYYLADPRDCYVYNDGRPIPHYKGVQVILPAEIADDVKLAARGPGRVWAVDMRDGKWGRSAVPKLVQWSRVAEQSFPEVYDVQGEVVITAYDVLPGSEGAEK